MDWLIDTNAPVSPARKFRGGDAYKATGRSLLMFERVPILAATTGGAGAADLPASEPADSSPSRAEAKQPLREDGGASSSDAATSPSL